MKNEPQLSAELVEIINEIAQVLGQNGAGSAWSESIRQRLLKIKEIDHAE